MKIAIDDKKLLILQNKKKTSLVPNYMWLQKVEYYFAWLVRPSAPHFYGILFWFIQNCMIKKEILCRFIEAQTLENFSKIH